MRRAGRRLELRSPLKATPADDRGRDSDDLVGDSVDRPGLHGQLQNPMQLGRFGDDSRHALDKNAPPAQAASGIAVSFEGEDSAGGGCMKLCTLHAAKDDIAVHDCEVNWQHRWKVFDVEADTSDRRGAQQAQAFTARQLDELQATHSFRMRDSPNVG